MIDSAIKFSLLSHSKRILEKLMRPVSNQRQRQGPNSINGYFMHSIDQTKPQKPKKPGLSSAWARILESHKQSLEVEKSSQHVHKGDARKSMVNRGAIGFKQQEKTPKRVIITTKQSEVKVLKKRGRPPKNAIFNKREFIISLEQVFHQAPLQISEPSHASLMDEINGQLQFCESQDVVQIQQAQFKADPPQREQKKLFKQVDFRVQLQEYVETVVESHPEEMETNIQTYPAQTNLQNVRPSSILIIDDEKKPKQTQQANNDSPIQIITPQLPRLLGKATLKDLVSEIHLKEFISEPLYAEFIANHSFNHILTFIDMFYAGKLHQFDYQSIKFTLLDHRRIVELLINLFPTEYVLGPPESPHPKVLEFLQKMYELSGEEYYNLYYKIDNISRVKWWGKILIVQEERLSSSYKEKRVNQRRAERAKQAVEDLIKSFKEKQKTDDAVDSFRASKQM